MKVFQFCMAFWLVGVLFLPFNCFRGGLNQSRLVSGHQFYSSKEIVDGSTMTSSRNLKENIDHAGSCGDEVSLEDYPPYDASPSNKASIRPGPIEHGAPLMPYIPNPKPSPPPRLSDDDDDESPSPTN